MNKALAPADAARQRELEGQLRQLDRYRPAPLPAAMGLRDGPAPRTFVLERGERNSPGAEVRPGYPTVLTGGKESDAAVRPLRTGTTGRRRHQESAAS